jgi:GNAT superfamily N-acetyltransferase
MRPTAVDVIVRSYEPPDRSAVREICCDTADSGKPVERFFPDREVFADLLTRYYTDFEPGSTWIAEQAGRVVGYLTGCLDTARFLRLMAWRITPQAVLKALERGTVWHPQTLQLLSVNLSEWLRGGFQRAVPLRDYPAHLHINLRAEARGSRVGQQLMQRFFEQAWAAGVNGVHAGVGGNNDGGQRFFESQGFKELTRGGRFRHPEFPDRISSTIIYGKKL